MSNFRHAVVAAAALVTSLGGAHAGEQYAFPTASGIAITAPPTFAAPAPKLGALPGVPADAMVPLPPPSYAAGPTHYESARSKDAYAYRFLTHALPTQSYSNYAADYYRLFAPGYAVSTWTDRMFGVVDAGYGAVDGWTAASYYMPRLRGPARRRDSAPDLSVMPDLRSHPELESAPTFNRTN